VWRTSAKKFVKYRARLWHVPTCIKSVYFHCDIREVAYGEILDHSVERLRNITLLPSYVLNTIMAYKGKGSPYSITERRVPELIPVLGSQPAGDVGLNHNADGRLPLLSARPAVTPQPLRGLLPILLLGEQRRNGCEQFA